MSSPLAGKRVLVVDDEEDVLQGILLALESVGAIGVGRTDGAEALHAAHTEKWDAIVLDMMLPSFSGLALVDEINATPSPPPIIMITANQGQRHRDYATLRGVSGYLQKPVALSRLLAALCGVISPTTDPPTPTAR
ncbi:MAG: response regulator [Planctomycetota bacterium]|nr:response regulator [Planctomycetota bacterium]